VAQDAGREIKKGINSAGEGIKKAAKTVGKKIDQAGSRRLEEVEVSCFIVG